MAPVEMDTTQQMEATRPGATYLADVAETIRDDALKQACAGLGNLAKRLDQRALFERPDFVERFKFQMAKAVALAVAANDQRVEEVHLYDPELNPEGSGDCIDATVHLLAVVSTRSAALESFIASLDRSLVHSLSKVEVQLFKQRESILDVRLITQEDIASNSGYAVLLRSIHAPALKLWERGEPPGG